MVRRACCRCWPVACNPTGGPVIGVQLDNEIGMLAWVSNSPVLNARVAADFVDWLTVTGSA